MIGRTISHYRIEEKLGEGGMGVVYRAEDTQLRRPVALKFLARGALDDADIRARLVREAQAAASLDHPNICAVHGIHQEDGETFLAMAYVDGPSLADKIRERPLPLDEALDVACQISEGLAEAHEKGIVHRDVKPQNVMLTAKGQVKIMDFGLASLAGRSKLTQEGTTLGTLAYMSPEQIEAGAVDRRADIWALGCVLYEMLAQRTPFHADYEQAIAYGALNEETEPLTALRSGLPTEIDRIIGKALAKDPDERYQHADDFLADLRVLRKQSDSTRMPTLPPAPSEPVVVSPPSRRLLPWAVAVLLGAALIALAVIHFSEAPPERRVRRFSIVEPGLQGAAISPDGRNLAMTIERDGRSSLWVRPLDSEVARELPGTEGAHRLPFWSPDSGAIGFSANRNELKTVPLDGRSATSLFRVAFVASRPVSIGSWSPDGRTIAFLNGLELFRVNAQGGEPEQLLEPPVYGPHFLPARRGMDAIVYAAGDSPTVTSLKTLTPGDRTEKDLGLTGANPVFAASGHLIFISEVLGGLSAVAFSLDRLAPIGEPKLLSETGIQPTVSSDRTLSYLEPAAEAERIVILDRSGRIQRTIDDPGAPVRGVSLSSDGRLLASSVSDRIWIYELDRDLGAPLSADAVGKWPSWSARGEVLYQGGPHDVLAQAPDGSYAARSLAQAKWFGNFGVSRDGSYFVFNAVGEGEEGGILFRRFGPNGVLEEEIQPLLLTPATEQFASLSPDSRYVAYHSDESGRLEVYVREFPSGAGRVRISTDGGVKPRWSADGTELFYVEGTTLMSVPVSTEPTFSRSEPTELFELDGFDGRSSADPTYDVFPDAESFVVVAPSERAEAQQTTIRIVENWDLELDRLAEP